MPTKARKCSALCFGGGRAAVRTRCPCGRCGGGCRACGAIGAGGRSRSPCPRAVSPAFVAVGRGGNGWVESRARGVRGRGCHACWHRRSPETGAVRSGRRAGGFSIPACRGRSDSVRSVAPFCGPDADGVDRAPRPVQLAPSAELVEDDSVEPGPDSILAPLGEAPVNGGPGRPEHRRKLPPGAARGGHEDDRCQAFTVTRPPSSDALRTYDLCRRDHPPKQRPQLVRHQPLHQNRHARLNERSRH
ncbi:hypothetical protein RKD44_001487 [Streptomyces collinus]